LYQSGTEIGLPRTTTDFQVSLCTEKCFDVVLQSGSGGDESQDGGGGSNILSLISTILGGSSGVSNKFPFEAPTVSESYLLFPLSNAKTLALSKAKDIAATSAQINKILSSVCWTKHGVRLGNSIY
jgi:hypothetical protein